MNVRISRPRVMWALLLLSLLYGETSIADLSHSFYKFSNIFGKYDAIIEGEAVNIGPVVKITVDDYIDGVSLGDTLQISFNPAQCDFCFSFWEGKKYIVFITVEEEILTVTHSGSGAFRYASRDDILLLTFAFKEHPDLFTPAHSELLKEIFTRFTESDSRLRLLCDFIDNPALVGDDSDFIVSCIESDDPYVHNWSFELVIRAALPSMRPYMENLLQSTDDPHLKMSCLSYIGAVRHPDSIPLVMPLIDDPYTDLRKHAYFVLGLYAMNGYDYLLELFRDKYVQEEDVYARSSLITAIYRANNSTRALEILREIINYETDDSMRAYLERRIQKLEEVYVDNNYDKDIPSSIILFPNAPNPFNPTTTITYSIPESSHVKLVVYTVSGRKVATLVDGFMPAGKHTALFDGSRYASGVYFYMLTSGDFEKSGKMLLVK